MIGRDLLPTEEAHLRIAFYYPDHIYNLLTVLKKPSLGSYIEFNYGRHETHLELSRANHIFTLKELMVTLAHRNANVVIGGFSSRVIKNLHDQEVQGQMQLIQRASKEIEAVIASLESLSQVNRTKYIGEWETKMIDLKQELEARLATFESPKDVS